MSSYYEARRDYYRTAKVPAPERLKSTEEDRISKLPEALIVHILSFLPTRYRIRTGSLSRRWQYLWTQVPKLRFDMDEHDDAGGFVKNVNQTLILCSGSKLKDFEVRMYYESSYESNVTLWTRFAARIECDKLQLDLPYTKGSGSYTLPQLLYSYSSFRELEFRYCNVLPRGTVSWKSLKNLSISGGRFSDDALQKILAGSPALEVLKLFLDRGIYNFDFGNSGVKNLFVAISSDGNPKEAEASMLVISAPNVQGLGVSGYFRIGRLLNMTSLVAAALYAMDRHPAEYPVFTLEVLSALSNAQGLILSNWIIQGIQTLPENSVLPPLSKCKHLTIDTHLWKTDPSAIASLLRITPGIETLTVTISFSKEKFLQAQHGNSNIDQYWASQVATCGYVMHLRTVKFVGFWAYRTHAFSFVRFVLKNAKVLEKMTINLGMKGDCTSVVPVEELHEAYRKLLSFPRSSHVAQVLVYL